jgi:hypothetical protein
MPTNEEIEGIIHLARFLAKYQDDLNKLKWEFIKIEDQEKLRESIAGRWPTIQGTHNVIALTRIGQQEIDFSKMPKGVEFLLKEGEKK